MRQSSIFCILDDNPGVYTPMIADDENSTYISNGSWEAPNNWLEFGFEEKFFLGIRLEEATFQKMKKEVNRILLEREKSAAGYTFAILIKDPMPVSEMTLPEEMYFKYKILVHKY